MRVQGAILAALLLAGCDGGSVGGSSSGGPTSSPMDPVVLNGWSMNGEGAYVSNDAGDVNSDSVDFAFAFDDSGGLTATFSGETVQLVWDDSAGAYVGIVPGDGSLIKVTAYNDPSTPDVFVFKTTITSLTNDATVTAYGTSGYLTPGASLPTSGNATYSGGVEMTDHLSNTADGSITFTVNLGTDNVSGALSIQDGLVIGAATFTFDNGVVQRGGGFSNFRGTLDSTDVTITSSQIFGDFMGSTGDQVGGVVYIATDNAGMAGVFTAKQ